MAALEAAWRRRFPGQLSLHTIRSPRYAEWLCEIAPAGVTKWTGVTAVAAGWGIAAGDICAVGDDVNDLPMVRAAGLGIAMGNARPELQAVADRVVGLARRRRDRGRGRAGARRSAQPAPGLPAGSAEVGLSAAADAACGGAGGISICPGRSAAAGSSSGCRPSSAVCRPSAIAAADGLQTPSTTARLQPHRPRLRCRRGVLLGARARLRRGSNGSTWRPRPGQGPPPEAVAWWRSRQPEATDEAGPVLAPIDVLLDALEALEESPADEAVRYLLALQLVRRRALRIEAPPVDGRRPSGATSSSPAAGATATYRVPPVSASEAADPDVAARLQPCSGRGRLHEPRAVPRRGTTDLAG